MCTIFGLYTTMYRELYIVVYGQISDMDQRWRKTKEMRLIDTNITCGAKL